MTSLMILLIVTIKDITCMQSHDIINELTIKDMQCHDILNDTINSNNYYLTF